MPRDEPPRKAITDLLRSTKGTIKESSYRAYRFPTKHFVEFLEKQ